MRSIADRMSSVRPKQDVPDATPVRWRWNISRDDLAGQLRRLKLGERRNANVGVDGESSNKRQKTWYKDDDDDDFDVVDFDIEEKVSQIVQLINSEEDEEKVNNGILRILSIETLSHTARQLFNRLVWNMRMIVKSGRRGVLDDNTFKSLKNSIKNGDLKGKGLEQILNELDEKFPGVDPVGNTSKVVGRLSLRENGHEKHEFLVAYSSASVRSWGYKWTSETEVKRDFLQAYNELADERKGADQDGKGWVVEVMERTGRLGDAQRQYKVKCTVWEDHVPSQQKTHWISYDLLVEGAKTMADTFEGVRMEEDDEEDEEDGEDRDGMRAPVSALRWDMTSGSPRLSLRLAITKFAINQPWTIEALTEYALTKKWGLMTLMPPAFLEGRALPSDEMDQLGEDLFKCKYTTKEAMRRAWQASKSRGVGANEVAAGAEEEEEENEEGGEEEDEEEDEEEEEFDRWIREQKADEADDAKTKWNIRQGVLSRELIVVERQIKALKVLKLLREQKQGIINENGKINRDALENDVGDVDVVELLREWAGDSNWPRLLTKPPLRLPAINDFYGSGRSAMGRAWLDLLRQIHKENIEKLGHVEIWGSAYGPSWPKKATPRNTPPDHVVPVRWFEFGTKLLLECHRPEHMPAVVMSVLSHNSAKLDSALGVFSAHRVDSSKGQGVWSPPKDDVTIEKKAMLAKTVAWIWLLYPLISDRKSTVGIGAYSRSTGCSWYAAAWREQEAGGVFKKMVSRRATAYERRVNILTSSMNRWRVQNPFVFNEGGEEVLDSDAVELLQKRFDGVDLLSKLVDEALQNSVTGAPQ